jgi:NAD(P)-dependent dehydrogenase (short-subunit alcohol dehydrogenase family)
MTSTALTAEWPLFPDLAGKVALVTGGSKALGAAACRALAANGVAVAVSGRDTEALGRVVAEIAAAGGRAVAVPADVTDQDAVTRLAAEAESQLGPVDILLPFAGGNGFPVPTAQMTAGQWQATLDSDLTSVFLTVSAVLPGMIERGGGAVITMASDAGRRPGRASAAYAAAKAGVVMFSKHLASELAGHGIRVNCLAPSAVLNERMRAAMTGQQLAELGASFPLGRIGQPTDIGTAVLYLASDAASWITGVTLDITGGRVII